MLELATSQYAYCSAVAAAVPHDIPATLLALVAIKHEPSAKSLSGKLFRWHHNPYSSKRNIVIQVNG